MIRVVLLILGPVCVVIFIIAIASYEAFQLQQVGGSDPKSSIVQASLSLQDHITGPRSNQYNSGDPFMRPVLDYWAKSCPGSGPNGICELAQSGNLQCVEFVTAAYWLAGDPLPSAPDAEQFWDTYAAFASWQRIPSPSAFPTAPKQAPNLGDLMVFRGGAHLSNGHLVEFGHIGVVVGFDAPLAEHDGSIEIAEANAPGTKFPPQSTNPFIASDKPGNTYVMTVHPDYRIDTWGPYSLGGVAYSGMTVLGFLHDTAFPQKTASESLTATTPSLPQELFFGVPSVQASRNDSERVFS